MTIASALSALNTDIVNARTAITNKGGTVTANGGSSQLATDIATIPTGSSSSKYGASIDNFLGDINTNSKLLRPTGQIDLNFTGVKTLENYALSYTFTRNNTIRNVTFPDLTEVDGGMHAMSYAFYYSSVETASFPKLTRIAQGFQNSFYYSSLTNVSLPELTSIGGVTTNLSGMSYAFSYSKIITLEFPKLTTMEINSYGFASACSYCNDLVTVRFPKLETIPTKSSSANCNFYNAFVSCPKITDIYFNALKTTSFTGGYTYVFSAMFNSSSGRTNGCTVHFPSNLSSTISALNGYPTFGGNANYISIAFDLPATS